MDLSQHYTMLLGLTPQWRVENVDLDMEGLRVEIIVEWAGGGSAPCPECGEDRPVYDIRDERRWRHLDTMQFETVIRCRVPRCKCPEHGVRTIKVPWADKHGRFTLMFEAFAIRVLQASSNVEAARKLLNLSWGQTNHIRERAVERGMERRKEEELDYVGLDEKSFGKHHDYISVLTDLKRGRVLEVAPGRKQEAAEELLLSLSAWQRAAIMAVALDMWPAFKNAVDKHLSGAAHVHDKYHVYAHLNKAVDQVRKAEHKVLTGLGDETLKGSKYLFLKKEKNMKESQRERFLELKGSKLKSARARAIADMFEEFWTFEFVADAQAFFKQWYGWAVRCRLKPMRDKAKMLKKHLDGLLNYILHPITNATTEGLNSKIQQIKSAARGFRSFESYRVAILFYCGKLEMMPNCSPFPQKT